MNKLREVFIAPNELNVIPGAKPQSTLMSILVGLFAAVGGFIYGYDTGIINSIAEMEYVRQQFASNGQYFTAKETSLITAILSLGTFFGALLAPFTSDSIGRRYTIIFSCFLVFIVGNICQIAATGIPLLCIGRFITGLSVGLISAVVPLYQAEASPKYVRGAIISTYQWAITWGLLISSAVSQGTQDKHDSSSYRVPIGIQFFWSLVLGTGMIFLPESPRFWILKDDLNKAAYSLSILRRVPPDDPGLIEELVEIKASYDYENSFGSSSFIDCFRDGEGRPKQLKRMITSVTLQAIQQCSGINFIFYYGVNFFSKTGVSQSYLISFVTYAVNVLCTVPGILLVELIGRRRLLIGGGTIMAVSNFIIAIVGITTNSIVANRIMISFVCIFIASFAASWGPTVWVCSGELFSLGVRGQSVALAAATNWLVNFVFAYITPYLVDTGQHTAALGTRIFFLWGGLNFVGVVFVYFMVYETKGLSLEEVNELYRNCSSARSSRKYKDKVHVPRNDDTMNATNSDHQDDDNNNTELQNMTNIPDEKKVESSSNTSDTADSPGPHSSGDPTSNQQHQDHQQFQQLPLPSQHFHQARPQQNHPGYQIDFGYGLGLNGQQRGPPSLASGSDSDTDSDFNDHEDEDRTQYSSLSEYVSRLSSLSQRRSSNQTGVTSNTVHSRNIMENSSNNDAIEDQQQQHHHQQSQQNDGLTNSNEQTSNIHNPEPEVSDQSSTNSSIFDQ
ncbi:High-affinity glucose transporter [Wickerhamomyces ciferrii]|uniref:High-affinity glucose transporter n=1 Tax=Wickerhamomyces ciferrii (strain ATCC 14091 / BCRC 22168 / CBS 111 / JCM 3599 / NBRC 0793 / NRRL Y-1031 F-60-10) TaxID=1206466 RepID=K0KJZ2_WICCF|nr:High-affinity glucose transporter [Wickerhamomyces ciferrii]CCH41443.1 High-affinity glucose transporter [Wickerhamomyces ciferrii]